MRDFIFQQKKINWQVNVRFNGLAMYSYRQNHLALWVGDMAYWDLISVSQQTTARESEMLAYVLNQQQKQSSVSLSQNSWIRELGWVTYNIFSLLPQDLGLCQFKPQYAQEGCFHQGTLIWKLRPTSGHFRLVPCEQERRWGGLELLILVTKGEIQLVLHSGNREKSVSGSHEILWLPPNSVISGKLMEEDSNPG